MRIVYLHQYFNTPNMPGSTRSYEMALRMVAAGHEVHMVTSIRESEVQFDDWVTSEESGIQVHWFPVRYTNQMSFLRRISAFFLFAFASRKKVAELEGDLIFATSTPLTIALPAVSSARNKKIPMVFEVRDLWPEMPIAMGALNNPVLRFAAKRLELWAYHNSAAVIALSPGMKDGIVAAGYPSQRVAVIPNSSDNRKFILGAHAAAQFRAEREWLGEKPLLVYAGTFGKVNGVGYMVELAKELQALDSDARILLVGSGAERDTLVESAKEAGVYQVNLFVENSLPKREIPALLSAATVASNLVIDVPEARANSANKFFDTLAAGKPILLNHGGWMHDLVEAHQCGLPMWQKSVHEVARALDMYMHDKEWLKNAGLQARKLAEEHFDRDRLAVQMMDVFHAVIAGKADNVQKIAPGNYG